jgi:hypothetical protein
LLEFGISEGLAYKHNFQQDIANLHAEEALDRQARIDAEAKAQLLSEKFKFGKTYDTYNDQRLKQFTEQQIKNIGAFVDQNKDFQYSPGKLAWFNKMTNELADNPIVMESARVETNRQQMIKWAQEHPESVNSPRYQNQVNAYSHYSKNGTTDPTLKQTQEFMFQPPTPYEDLGKAGLEMGNKFGDFDIVPLKGWGMGAFKEVPKQDSLNATISNFYAMHRDQMNEEYKIKGYASPLEYSMALVTPGIKGKKDIGDYNYYLKVAELAMKAKETQGEQRGSPYQEAVINNHNAGTLIKPFVDKIAGEKPDKMISINKKGETITWEQRSAQMSTQFITADQKRMKELGLTIDPNHPERDYKLILGTTTISRDEAVDRGIVANAIARGFNEQGSKDVEPDWQGLATVRKDANDEWVVDIQSYYPFDYTSPGYKGLYDSIVQPTKFQQPAEEMYQNAGPAVRRGKSPSGREFYQTKDGTIYDAITNQPVDPNTEVH